MAYVSLHPTSYHDGMPRTNVQKDDDEMPTIMTVWFAIDTEFAKSPTSEQIVSNHLARLWLRNNLHGSWPKTP
jgi:hypothetical protein